MADFISFQDDSDHGSSSSDHSKVCKNCMARQSFGRTCRRCGGRLLEPTSPNDAFIGSLIADKYKLVEKLGAGGMGVVYRGVNEQLGQNVAVKFLHAKFAADADVINRFITEAKSYARVSHPNAVTLLDYGQHNQNLYIITEFIDGDSLSDVLRMTGPLSVVDCVHVALQICEVLSVAHAEGVIHRDLKPDNIMLKRNSRGRYVAKVLDFGIAKIADNDQGPVTQTGLVFGTPEFMSPEQARGWDAGPRSDLYALGIIMYYAVTGKLPFRGKNKLGILNKQINNKPVPLSKVKTGLTFSQPFEMVVEKLLEKSPEDRFQSADELAEVLEQVRAYEIGDSVPNSIRLIESAQQIHFEPSPVEDSVEDVSCDDSHSSDMFDSEPSFVPPGRPSVPDSSEIETCDLDDTYNLRESEVVGIQFGDDEETREASRNTFNRSFEDAFEMKSPDVIGSQAFDLHREHPYHRFEVVKRRERRRLVLGVASIFALLLIGIVIFAYVNQGSKDAQVLNQDSLAQLEKIKNGYVPTQETTDANDNGSEKDVVVAKVANDDVKAAPAVQVAKVADVVKEEAPSNDFKQQLLTIKKILDSGDVAAAQRNLIAFSKQSSVEWNQAEQQAVKQLRDDIDSVRTWRIQVGEALEARNCGRASEIKEKIVKISSGAAKNYAEAIHSCEAGRQIAANAPTVKPVVPIKSAPVVPVVAPKPTVVAKNDAPKPAVTKPAAAKPAPVKVEPVKVAVAKPVEKKEPVKVASKAPVAVAKHVEKPAKTTEKSVAVAATTPKVPAAPAKATLPKVAPAKPAVAPVATVAKATPAPVAKVKIPETTTSVAKVDVAKTKKSLPPIHTIANPAGIPDEDDFLPSVSEFTKKSDGYTVAASTPAYQPPVHQQSSIRPVKELPSKHTKGKQEKAAMPPKKL